MSFFDRVESRLLHWIDQLFERLPRVVPDTSRLAGCRVVSHRGEHGGRMVLENTRADFDAGAALGVWGIECDLRWTRDLVPVVAHDPDLRRVFGLDRTISACTLQALQRDCPGLPTLAEVIGRYGGNHHLMVEVKRERYPHPDRQNRILRDLFAGLTPGADFHLLSLAPEMFRLTPFAPPSACIPVARLNVPRLSRLALRNGYGGVAGHYVLLGNAVIRRQHAAGQGVGTGYPRSLRVLAREVNRQVDWIFTNHAGDVQGWIRRLQRYGG
jgi:glycerophosphoryl diester phosphodiesterase